MTTLICDTEIYRNYFLAAFLDVETGAVQTFERHDDSFIDVVGLRNVLMQNTIVTFNGTHFDLPLLSMATRDATNSMLKETCDKIIQNNLSVWRLGVKVLEVDHIDLIEVAPGTASLKVYGGRLNCRTMQDLPIAPDEMIDEVDAIAIREYCINDLQTTLALYRKLQPQIELRQKMGAKYGVDLRSKSDAQIAEAVIRSEFSRLTGKEVAKPKDLAGKVFRYQAPEFIRFSSKTLTDVLEKVAAAEFKVGPTGAVTMPKDLDGLEVRIGEGVYRMGIGGLHSSEKSIAHHANENTVLIDRDVASYYPSIILRCGLFPAGMGQTFLDIYRGLVTDRLTAKRRGAEIKQRISELERELANAN